MEGPSNAENIPAIKIIETAFGILFLGTLSAAAKRY